jgi:hypothetical protein
MNAVLLGSCFLTSSRRLVQNRSAVFQLLGRQLTRIHQLVQRRLQPVTQLDTILDLLGGELLAFGQQPQSTQGDRDASLTVAAGFLGSLRGLLAGLLGLCLRRPLGSSLLLGGCGSSGCGRSGGGCVGHFILLIGNDGWLQPFGIRLNKETFGSISILKELGNVFSFRVGVPDSNTGLTVADSCHNKPLTTPILHGVIG